MMICIVRLGSVLLAFFLAQAATIVNPIESFGADTGIDFEDQFVRASNLGKSVSPVKPGSDNSNLRGGLVPAAPAALSTDDGLVYVYERACTAGVGSDLDPAQCPRVDARCDAQDGGVLVNWIEVNSNVQPASQTPTGRSSCMYPGLPPVPPVEVETPAVAEAPVVITIEEFQKQPVLAAEVVSQPLNFGLRNAHSNIYAEAVEQDFTFEFQDAMIVLKARPVSYQWSYGDSTSATTSTPGGPVDGVAFNTQTSTSHQYVQTGDFTLTLTTFFAGDYSVDGGPFQPVAGEASVMSEPHLMSIWRTKGHSVSENCIENPTGIGCEAPTR
jgi:hypothetical protein